MEGQARYELQFGGSEDAYVLHFNRAEAGALSLASDWVPGELLWTGIVGAQETAVQVRPILNGFALAHRGVLVAARVYTRREAELAALMPVKAAPDTSRFLACPMPGLIKEIA